MRHILILTFVVLAVGLTGCSIWLLVELHNNLPLEVKDSQIKAAYVLIALALIVVVCAVSYILPDYSSPYKDKTIDQIKRMRNGAKILKTVKDEDN